MFLTEAEHKDNSIIKQVGLYIRVSTFDQAVNGTSLEVQELALKKWVELDSDKGWVLAPNGVYIDDGYSGAKGREERPAYNRMLTDIENGNINIVLVYKLDRLARSSKIIEDALLTFEEKKVKFFSKDDGINNATDTSKFLISIMAALAQMERTLIFERTYSGRIAKLSKGYAGNGGFPLPYGYTKAEDKKIIINDDEAKIVKHIFEECVTKHKLPKDIANDLTLQKVKTWYDNKMEAEEKKQAMQGIWSADTVRDLLLNTIYKGVYYFGKTKKVRVNMPVGIVDEDLWERAREEIQKFNKLKRGNGTAYIFTGLIKCGFDGMSYTHYPRTKEGVLYHYYRCGGSNTSKMSNRKKDTDKGILVAPVCNNLQVPEKELYDKCISVITEFINEPEKLYKEKVGNNVEVQKQLMELNASVIKYEEELKETNKTINGLIYKIAENPALEDNYKDVVEKYTRDKNTLIKTLEDTKKSIRLVEQQINSGTEIKNFAKTYKNKLKDLTIEQGTELIRLLVEKIEVKGTLINIFFKFKPHPESLLNNAESVKKNFKNLEVGDFGVYSDPNTKCLQCIYHERLLDPGNLFIISSPMPLDIIRRSSTVDTGGKSKKFFRDFKVELQKTLLELEILLTLELGKLFSVNSLFLGNNDIKIRIRDESLGLDKIVSVIFRYHHDDEKYGNVHVEIVAYELSKKTKTHFLGRFLVTDRTNINKEVLGMLILAIRAIY